MSKNTLISALEALEPETKAAKLRAAMPVIEEKIAAGVRIAVICETLKRSGIDVNEGTLKSYLQRHRKKLQGQQPAKEDTPPKPVKAPVSYDTQNEEQGQDQAEKQNEQVLPKDLSKIMKPDDAQQAVDLDNYERLGKRQRRKST